jgi:predicted nucleic acid-binding protein
LNPVLADENCRALSSLGLTVLPVENDDLWRNAAKIKAQHPMSLADAFAVTTAQAYKTKLVVGSDREFRGANKNLLRIRK